MATVAEFHYMRLPQTLKRLLVFEDFNENLAAILNVTSSLGMLFTGPQLGDYFAPPSLNLEQLSISYMTSAEEFFRACSPTWKWQNLQSLALTSRFIIPTGLGQDINDLLCRAGALALQMPKLHTLALWNGGRGIAAAFIY
ncbi:hypothetical protein V492_03300 [Pseudogymnoascus sp. VKM F-4246]|nr:hypothetical protein V492_03300 [Pseudogymnoascus sp. VKM F-4246]